MGAFDFIGDFFNKDARDRAAREQQDAIDVYGRMNTEINGQQAGNFDVGNLDTAPRDAQMGALNQLAGIGSAGGLDPQSLAAMQQAQMATNQNAKSNTDAALERASSEGRLNSGRSLSAQIQANQGAQNANAMAGQQAVGDARTRAMQAMAATGSLGGNIRAADYGQAADKAKAQAQINMFNANMRQNAAQQSFNNENTRAAGIERGDQAMAATNLGRAQEARESAGAIGDAVVKGATAAATGGLSTMGDAMSGIGSAAQQAGQAAQHTDVVNAISNVKAKGGLIHGKAKVEGDSEANDTVPTMLSPGEVVLPRSTVEEGPEAAKRFLMEVLRGRR